MKPEGEKERAYLAAMLVAVGTVGAGLLIFEIGIHAPVLGVPVTVCVCFMSYQMLTRLPAILAPEPKSFLLIVVLLGGLAALIARLGLVHS